MDLEALGLALLLGLTLVGGKKNGVDVGDDTRVGDGDIGKKLVELLVVADGEHHVAGDNADLLVITRGVASKLENLGREVPGTRNEDIEREILGIEQKI